MSAENEAFESGESSRRLYEKKEKYVTKSLQSFSPGFIKKGKGARVTDVDGNSFIDLSGGWGCQAVGYSHPKVVEAIKDQAENFTHTDYTAIPYSPFVKLAERLSKLHPGDSHKKGAFFNCGAEAVENAVKIARAHTGRNGVVVFENAFHGRTLLTMTMTHKADPYKNGFGPFAPEVYRLPYPNPYRNDFELETLEKKLTHMVDPREIAALVVEPIIGEGGFIVPPEGFLSYLRELTDKYGIDLVFDEIQCGMGRTGKFFAAENWGVESDISTLAKSLASGMPLSAVIGKEDIMDSPPTNSIGGTYVGNPVACRAALAVLEVIEEEGLLERAEEIGDYIKDRFQKMEQKFDVVGETRGVGAMRALELVKDEETKEPAKKLTGKVSEKAMSKGVLLPTAGINGNVIRMLVPLVIEKDRLEKALDLVEESIEELA